MSVPLTAQTQHNLKQLAAAVDRWDRRLGNTQNVQITVAGLSPSPVDIGFRNKGQCNVTITAASAEALDDRDVERIAARVSLGRMLWNLTARREPGVRIRREGLIEHAALIIIDAFST